MNRLAYAMQAVCADTSGSQLAEILAIPKRTADRWLAELRVGGLDNWNGTMIERLANHEGRVFGTTRIADALRPVVAEVHHLDGERADSHRLAMVMRAIITSHQVNFELLAEMAEDLSDGILQLQEVRDLMPLVAKAQIAATQKHQALIKLQVMLENRLRS